MDYDDPLLAEYKYKRRQVINEKWKRCRDFKDMVVRGDKGSYLTYK